MFKKNALLSALFVVFGGGMVMVTSAALAQSAANTPSRRELFRTSVSQFGVSISKIE